MFRARSRQHRSAAGKSLRGYRPAVIQWLLDVFQPAESGGSLVHPGDSCFHSPDAMATASVCRLVPVGMAGPQMQGLALGGDGGAIICRQTRARRAGKGGPMVGDRRAMVERGEDE